MERRWKCKATALNGKLNEATVTVSLMAQHTMYAECWIITCIKVEPNADVPLILLLQIIFTESNAGVSVPPQGFCGGGSDRPHKVGAYAEDLYISTQRDEPDVIQCTSMLITVKEQTKI